MTVVITYEQAGKRQKINFNVPNLKRRFAIIHAINSFWIHEDIGTCEIVDIHTKRK